MPGPSYAASHPHAVRRLDARDSEDYRSGMADGADASVELHAGLGGRLGNSLRGFAERHPGWVGMSLVLVAGMAARAVLSTRDGHLSDVNLFLRWMRGLVEHGLEGFYAADASCNYPPLYLLILRGLGAALSHWDLGLRDTVWLRACLRVPACLTDIGIAVLLYVEVRRLTGSRAGVLAAALYFLNPVALYNSAYWGQVDSIHSGLALCALVALNRRWPALAGAATALALLQKFQSVVFVPLVLFDVYRQKRWRGLTWCILGGILAAVPVLAPFVGTGTLPVALQRGYVRVVGQYGKLSQNAFNVWYLIGHPNIPDESVPRFLVEAAAAGQVEVADHASWFLWLTYRRIAMGLFTLAVAVVLTLYSRRHGAADRALAAGLLVLAFFLCLTEMHERYTYPVIAVLPIWAVQSRWRERVYVLLSILLLLNLTVAQPVNEIGSDIARLTMVLWLVCFGGLLGSAAVPAAGPPRAHRVGDRALPPDSTPAPPASALVTWFGWLTRVAMLGAVILAICVGIAHHRAMPRSQADVLYLSELTPVSQRQEYGEPARDRSVEGGVIYLRDHHYLRGVGTHASSTLIYELPGGYRVFRALAGINRHFDGSARVRVFLDDRLSFSTEQPFRAGDRPVEIDLPLADATRLKLVTSPNGSTKGAHVDWALARLER